MSTRSAVGNARRNRQSKIREKGDSGVHCPIEIIKYSGEMSESRDGDTRELRLDDAESNH